MFCQAVIGALQAGQAERGVLRVKRAGGVDVAAAVTVSAGDRISLAWERHSRSSMMGSR